MVVLVVIAAALTLLSPIATAVVRHKLHNLPGYEGNVEAVTIAWWRAGITLRDFALFERGHVDDLPVVRVHEAKLRVAWKPLFQGKLGGAGVVEDAEFNAIKREPTPEKPEESADEKVKEAKQKVQRWQDVLRRTFPVELSRFELRKGTFRFVDRTKQPNVDVNLHDVHIVATNLTNKPKQGDGVLWAKVQMTGTTTGDGALNVTTQANPLAKQPTFHATFELKHLNLPAFNDFMRAYADADVSKGTFEVYTEVDAKDGGYSGYTKPFFKDLDFSNPSDKDKSLGAKIKEKAMAAVSSLLENDEDKKVATKAPFSGNFDQNDLDIWSTISNLLRNAFVQALREGLEGQAPTRKAKG